DGAVAQPAQDGQTGGRRERVAAERARLVDAPGRRELLHHLGAAPERRQRQTAAHDLPEHGQIGRHPVELLGAAAGDAEAGDHLVEHEQRIRSASRKPVNGGTQPMFPATGSTTIAASPSPYRSTAAATPSTSLYSQTIVSAVTPLGTPGDAGRPSVARPEPAFARNPSPCPCWQPANLITRSRFVKPRARRTADIAA